MKNFTVGLLIGVINAENLTRKTAETARRIARISGNYIESETTYVSLAEDNSTVDANVSADANVTVDANETVDSNVTSADNETAEGNVSADANETEAVEAAGN
jgi:hypothetical protein